MLHDRQQFNVGEAHALHVVRKFGRHFAISKRAVVLLRNSHPRAQVNFVDRNWRLQRLAAATRLHPLGVGPLIIRVPNH